MEESLAEANGLVHAAQQVRDKQLTTRQRERKLRLIVRRDPDNDEAWTELVGLECRHQQQVLEKHLVVGDWRRTELTLGQRYEGVPVPLERIVLRRDPGPGNSSNSNRANKVLYLAVTLLARIWREGTGQDIMKTTNPDDGQPNDEFFYWAEAELDNWGVDTKADALLKCYRRL